MSGQVLVGYDASAASRRALRWAAAEAERRGAALTVLTVMDHAVLADSPPPLMVRRWRAATTRGLRRASAGAAAASAVAPGVPVVARAQVGSPRELLIAASRQADVVVLGAPGHLGSRPGALVQAVAARSASPVIVVGPFGARPPAPDRPVVVGIDGSAGALAALDFAAAVAVAAVAPLHVVCVAGNPLRVRDHDEGSLDAALHLARICVERVRWAHPGLVARDVAADGDVPGALAHHARAGGLLVVGRRGSGARSPLVLGSVSRALLESGPMVLAVVGGVVPERTGPRTVLGERTAPAEALMPGA